MELFNHGEYNLKQSKYKTELSHFIREPSVPVLYKLTVNGSDELKKELVSLGIIIDLSYERNHMLQKGLYTLRLTESESEYVINQPLLWDLFDMSVVGVLDNAAQGREDFCWYILNKELNSLEEEPHIAGKKTTFLKQYIQGHFITPNDRGKPAYKVYGKDVLGGIAKIRELNTNQPLIKSGSKLYLKLLAELDELSHNNQIGEYMYRLRSYYHRKAWTNLTDKESRIVAFNKEILTLYDDYQTKPRKA